MTEGALEGGEEALSTSAGGGEVRLPNPTTKADWVRQYGRSLVAGRRHRGLVADVECFCFFVGYPRSGHSLVGSLLNAHREILIAHELDAVGHVQHHFGRAQLYGLLVERDRLFAEMGRHWTGYDYVVPHQFQGRSEKLRVIGDKRGLMATTRLGEDPTLLDRVRRVVGVPVRVVHITRNPYDNVATMARRTAAGRERRGEQTRPGSAGDVSEAIDRYAQMCRWVDLIRPRLAPGELYDQAYEDFLARPRDSLAALCRFLGVEADPGYLDDCAGVLWPEVRRTRDSVEWTAGERARVQELIGAYPVLGDYSWDR
ncbi:MAG TPA: sulfotransferase [Acidimicrobiales bacterium]|nr:sulfotransferase [Acidimicrobiales bacterium]